MTRTLILAGSTLAMSLMGGCASGPEKKQAIFPCGSGTVSYSSTHSQVASYLSVTSYTMNDSERATARIDIALGNGESYIDRPVPRVTAAPLRLPLGTGNFVTIRCPGGIVHTISNGDRTEALASNRRMFDMVQGVGNAANQMQAEADARRAYQNSLYANVPKPTAGKPATSDDAADGGTTAGVGTASARDTGSTARADAATSPGNTPGNDTASESASVKTGTNSTASKASTNGASRAQASAATSSGTNVGGKSTGGGALIVDDSAYRARLKQEADTLKFQQDAAAAAAQRKAHYAAEAAREEVRMKAAIEEERRKRLLKGRSQ